MISISCHKPHYLYLLYLLFYCQSVQIKLSIFTFAYFSTSLNFTLSHKMLFYLAIFAYLSIYNYIYQYLPISICIYLCNKITNCSSVSEEGPSLHVLYSARGKDLKKISFGPSRTGSRGENVTRLVVAC